MEAKFKVCKETSCKLSITGLESDSDMYLAESSSTGSDVSTGSEDKYTYLQSITLDILQSIDSSGNATFVTYITVPHTSTNIDEGEV
jgi:hypothetical protein